MADEILTDDQVVALTGASQVKKQKQVLSRAGIFFVDKMGGGISLTWGMVNRPGKSLEAPSFDDEPNFGAM
jgi:hypothetical protein